MKLKEYLRTLYGESDGGYIGISYRAGERMLTKWFPAAELTEIENFIKDIGAKTDTYICINPRRKKLTSKSRGSDKDVKCAIGCYMDFDIKSDAHAEKRLPETKEELLSFLDGLPNKLSLLCFSGHGYHAMWLFETPYEISDDEAKKYIAECVKAWERYVKSRAEKEHGWHFDSVSDLPRMLRAPESINFKTEDGCKCEVVSANDIRYSPSDFQPYIESDRETDKKEFDAFGCMGTGSAEELIGKCEFLQYCRDKSETLSEPMWHAAITNIAQTRDGQEAVHEISRPYPKYSYSETDAKNRRAASEDKPTTCEYIHKTLGFKCKCECGVKAPIALIRQVNKAVPDKWEEPIPFDEYVLSEFPVDALPKPLADYALALAESTQTPVDMTCVSVLPKIAVAMQGKYRIRAKADYFEPPNVFVVIIMAPSERKSAVENATRRPIDMYESRENAKRASVIEASKSRKRVLELKQRGLEQQVAKGKADASEIESVARELAEFQEVKSLRLYVDDITTEKLTSVLADNGGRTAILSTEGGIFDTLAGIYTKNVNIDVILKGYSGDSIRVDRIGRTSETVMHPTLTMSLMVQPNVLAGLMSNDTFKGRGLTARILYSIPKSMVGKRKYKSVSVAPEIEQAYTDRITNILEDEYTAEPELITLSDEADKMIERFAEELEPKLKSEYADIAEWAGKLVGNTLRIAGLLCRASVERDHDFLSDDEPLVISEEIMSDAIRIGRYFLEHARASFSLMGADKVTNKSKYVMAAIKEAGLSEFNRRDVMRLCRSFKKADEIQVVLEHLTDYGYIAIKDAGAYSGKGRPPAQTYVVNPLVYQM